MYFATAPYRKVLAHGQTWFHWPQGARHALDLRPLSGQRHHGRGLFAFERDPGKRLGISLIADDPQGIVPQTRRQALEAELGTSLSATRLDEILFELFSAHAEAAGTTRWRPVMPKRDGTIGLAIGPLAIRKRFEIDDPELSPKVIAVLRQNYKAQRTADRARGSKQYLRSLDWQLAKYRTTDHRLIQGDLPDEEPLPHATTATDSFDRADSPSLGTSSEGGWSWTNTDGWGFGIVSNAAESGGHGSGDASRADKDLSGDDHYVQAVATKVSGTGSVPDVGVIARSSSSGHAGYMYTHSDFVGGDCALYRINGFNNYTLITDDNDNHAAPNGDLMRLEVDGSDLEGFFAGVSHVTGTDTTHTGQTRTGLRAFRGGQRLDDFEAGDLVVGPSAAMPAAAHHYRQRRAG